MQTRRLCRGALILFSILLINGHNNRLGLSPVVVSLSFLLFSPLHQRIIIAYRLCQRMLLLSVAVIVRLLLLLLLLRLLPVVCLHTLLNGCGCVMSNDVKRRRASCLLNCCRSVDVACFRFPRSHRLRHRAQILLIAHSQDARLI